MATLISFTVYGHPVAKARARTVRTKTGQSVSYTPDKTVAWEESVRVQALAHRPDKPLEGPLSVAVDFYLTRPKSSKRKYPSVRPDLDNYIKSVKDALNGLMWCDDAQIVSIQSCKLYERTPRAAITIVRLNEKEEPPCMQ